MRQHKWFYSLLITTLLLASCQSTEVTSADPATQPLLQAKVNPLPISVSAQQMSDASVPEVNECLNCHADKQRLIDTAKEEEVVEAESSGVG
jgi:uncharacterized protein YcfL